LDDLERQVELLCPVCGGSQFETEIGDDGEVSTARCIACDREFTKSELLEENGGNISQHAEELGEAAADEVAEELKKKLQDAFE